jgi:hypothetical protein
LSDHTLTQYHIDLHGRANHCGVAYYLANEVDARVNELQAENARLREALVYYSNRNNYHGDGSMVRVGKNLVDFKPIIADNGVIARAALGKEY